MPRRGMGVEMQPYITVYFWVRVMPRRGMGVEIMGVSLVTVKRWRHAPQGHGSRNKCHERN